MAKILWAFVLALMLLLPPSSSHAQNTLDGWFQCLTYKTEQMTLPGEQYLLQSTVFGSGSTLVEVDNQTTSNGSYTNWICTTLDDGYWGIGQEGDEAFVVGQGRAYVVIVVPANVVGLTAECAWQQDKNQFSAANISMNGGNNGLSGDIVGNFYYNDNLSASAPFTMTYTAPALSGTLYNNWVDEMTQFPDPVVGTNTSPIGARLYMRSEFIIGTASDQYIDNEVACSLQQVLEYDGQTTTPIDRPPGGWLPVATPTPAFNGTPPSYNLTPFVLPTEYIQPNLIGLVPSAPSCTILIPSFAWGPYTVFGYTLQLNLAQYEICSTQYDLSLEWLGIDFASWITALIGLGAIGILYSRLK